MPREKPEKTKDGSAWKVPGGKVSLVPGSGSDKCCYSFNLANMGSEPICDFEISCKDLDFLCADPEISSQNDPAPKGPGVHSAKKLGKLDKDEKLDKTGAGSSYNLARDAPAGESSSRVRITIDPCVEPGEVMQLVLCFTEPLEDNEEITFWPSDKDGRPMTGTCEVPDPVRPKDVLNTIKDVGGVLVPLIPIPKPLSMKMSLDEAGAAQPALGLAINSLVSEENLSARLGSLHELSYSALRERSKNDRLQITADSSATLGDLWRSDTFRVLVLLHDLWRRASDAE